MSIKSSDISVVVQGNVETCTKATLESVRKYLPDAEIILSSWKGVDCQGLTYDTLILNDDPGAIKFDLNLNKVNNINRIIISTQAGLKKATRKYTLLLRSDVLLVNDNLLKFRDTFNRNKKVSLFKKRIYAYELFSIRSENKGKCYFSIFHISDWCRFGLTEDIKELFRIQPVEEPQFSQFFADKPHDKATDIWYGRMWKMSPEQYITSENAKKVYKNLQISSRLDWREEVLNASDEFIVNNFIIKSIADWGIISQKDLYKGCNIKSNMITADGAWLGGNWLKAYQKYIDSEVKLSLKYVWKDIIKVNRYVDKFWKHYYNFVLPIRAFLRKLHKFIEWLLEPLSMLYYLLKIAIKVLARFHRLFRHKC